MSSINQLFLNFIMRLKRGIVVSLAKTPNIAFSCIFFVTLCSLCHDEYFPCAVQVCGHELMAHRAVLACCSPYLFEIFNSDNEPHGVSHVTFEDLNPEAVEILLNYAYTAQSVARPP